MTIITILLTIFLEQLKLLDNIRRMFLDKLTLYVSYFSNRNIINQRSLRLSYLFACIPIVLLLLGIKAILYKHEVVYAIFNIFLFILSVQIVNWKNESNHALNDRSIITTYATTFFAPLFWYIALPSAIGSICYLIIILLSNEMKSKNLDTMIYNVVVDKMLFYLNVVPYTLLFLLLAFAGDFEEVSHFLLEQRKQFSKSFYYLENTLHGAVLIAIGKGKFQIDDFRHTEEIEAIHVEIERFDPQITNYIIAILYRAGLFFMGLLVIYDLAHLI